MSLWVQQCETATKGTKLRFIQEPRTKKMTIKTKRIQDSDKRESALVVSK